MVNYDPATSAAAQVLPFEDLPSTDTPVTAAWLQHVHALLADVGAAAGRLRKVEAYRNRLPHPRVGDWWIQGGSNMSSTGMTTNQLLLGPQFFPPGTYDAVGFHLNTVGSAGSVVRLAAYGDDNGRPGTLKLDCGTLDTSTGTGFRSITGLSMTVADEGELLWVGAVAQGAVTPPQPFFVNQSSAPYAAPGNMFLLWSGGPASFGSAGITGAAPSTSTWTYAGGHIRLAWRRSA